jgi:hypothetical protein
MRVHGNSFPLHLRQWKIGIEEESFDELLERLVLLEKESMSAEETKDGLKSIERL